MPSRDTSSDPGVAVPTAAELLDDALHLIPRDIGRALEVHVLDPVRNAREAGMLVLRSDVIPAPDRRERHGVLLLDEYLETVGEGGRVQAERRSRLR
jgi:hypothetical protein